jgi:uncharacterized protein YjbI with pentapeptide repeats
VLDDGTATLEACDVDGCSATRAEPSMRCLGHVGPPELDVVLAGISAGGQVDARGVTLDAPRLAAVIGAMPVADDALVLNGDFTGAVFNAPFVLPSARIDDARFVDATFNDDVDFSDCVFLEPIDFSRAEFAGEVSLAGARSEADLTFWGATFEGPMNFGRFTVKHQLLFRQAHFKGPLWLSAAAEYVDLTEAAFEAIAEISLVFAEISLMSTTFARPAVIQFDDFPYVGYQGYGLDLRGLQFRTPRPRLLTLEDCDVSNLSISGLDLQACRFFGAHNLDKLKFEGPSLFPQPPRNGIWTRRRTIAEEHKWRADVAQNRPRPRWNGWRPPETDPLWYQAIGDSVITPAAIATTYRELRRGLEDRKDQPGAADFYYGEMEMRRHSGREWHPTLSAPKGERLVIWLYWLVSGYGLRPLRSLGFLLLTMVLFTGLLLFFGFLPERADFGRALMLATEGATLRSGDRTAFSGTGQALQLALRILGPVFFALTLLAVRGRIKR